MKGVKKVTYSRQLSVESEKRCRVEVVSDRGEKKRR